MRAQKFQNIMNEYRFHLQKYSRGSKVACPKCGRRACFVCYIDEEGEVFFPAHVGKCDHVNRCGYHYTPREFFRDNPDVKPKADTNYSFDSFIPTRNHNASVQRKECKDMAGQTAHPSFIDESIVQRTLACYDINPLHLYLRKVFGEDEAMRLMQLYRVGTSAKWGGATVFWQTDTEGKVRGGKVMLYNANDGHRIKEPVAKVSWAHAELRLSDFHLRQCLFGEHLLPMSPDRDVYIVESEKTAIVAAHFMPDVLWLATGGKCGCFNSEAMQVLKGRNVTLMPDLGATAEWTAKQPMLSTVCKTVSVSHVLEGMATDGQRERGLDIADLLLMQETKQMILQRMIDRNPCLQRLIDELGLVIVEDD